MKVIRNVIARFSSKTIRCVYPHLSPSWIQDARGMMDSSETVIYAIGADFSSLNRSVVLITKTDSEYDYQFIAHDVQNFQARQIANNHAKSNFGKQLF